MERERRKKRLLNDTSFLQPQLENCTSTSQGVGKEKKIQKSGLRVKKDLNNKLSSGGTWSFQA